MAQEGTVGEGDGGSSRAATVTNSTRRVRPVLSDHSLTTVANRRSVRLGFELAVKEFTPGTC
jgi:hypothetical protein